MSTVTASSRTVAGGPVMSRWTPTKNRRIASRRAPAGVPGPKRSAPTRAASAHTAFFCALARGADAGTP
ncbi:hypothetical protein ACFVFF_04175 [Streptomyces sp. NPDC057680]|uniref:hypothetical protein n=1 Tax=Streptomyces sp. NPDC057680 TaxID=3346208 RepID=UPI0036823805